MFGLVLCSVSRLWKQGCFSWYQSYSLSELDTTDSIQSQTQLRGQRSFRVCSSSCFLNDLQLFNNRQLPLSWQSVGVLCNKQLPSTVDSCFVVDSCSAFVAILIDRRSLIGGCCERILKDIIECSGRMKFYLMSTRFDNSTINLYSLN